MRVASFEWDEANLAHAVRHGVSQEEMEEVMVSAPMIRKGRSGVYLAYGRTCDGRYVLMVFQHKGHGTVRPFSARPMTRNEKAMLGRWKK